MIDIVFYAAAGLVLFAGSVRIAIEIYLRRRALADRRDQAPEGAVLHAIVNEPLAAGDEPPTEKSRTEGPDDEVMPTDCTSPAALFDVEMGPAGPRLRIAIGGRAISVDIQPWQAAELGRSLLAASAASAPSAQPPLEGTVFA